MTLVISVNGFVKFFIQSVKPVEDEIFVYGFITILLIFTLLNILNMMSASIEKRKKVFERYADGLGNTEGIKLCFPGEGITHNYAYMPVLFTGAFNRDKVFDSLQKLNIFARKYFYPLTSDTEWYKINVPERKHTPIAAFVADNILCLPMYSELSSDEIDIIINAVLRSAE